MLLLFLTLQTSILDLTRKLVDVTYTVGANWKEKLNDISPASSLILTSALCLVAEIKL